MTLTLIFTYEIVRFFSSVGLYNSIQVITQTNTHAHTPTRTSLPSESHDICTIV